MIYSKEKPTGVDVPIQKAQSKLYTSLKSLWGCDLDAYGRAYLLKRRDLVIPEVFVGDIDYKDVLGFDSNRFFFTIGNSASKITQHWYSNDVSVYFILNLKEVKPNINHRADEEVHDDVDRILSKTDLIVNNLDIGIDNVLNEFKVSDRDNIKFADFEPYHVFKFDCSVNYNLKTKCNG